MGSKKRFKSNKDQDIKLTADRKDDQQYINWFPGHMNKAIKQIQGKLSSIDLILEIRDARVPEISRNTHLENAIGNKAKIVLLNKANLANQDTITKWKKYYHQETTPHLFINALDKEEINKLLDTIKDQVKMNFDQEEGSKEQKKKINLMIIGLPNTGKSTLINRLSNRNAARTANKPGLTQTQQWIKINEFIELLDTPGIMPPKIENYEDGLKLGAIFAIPAKIVSDETTACFLLQFLIRHYPQNLKTRYKIDEEITDYLIFLEKIGLQRQCLLKKGVVDYEKVYRILLTDFRNGDLGQISLETPK